MKDFDHPLRIDGRGRVATADRRTHLQNLVEQVLLTAPGERVNRPDFGSGIHELLFGPLSEQIAATTRLQVEGALQRWLGDLIEVTDAQAEVGDGTLTITVRFVDRVDGTEGSTTITRRH